MTTAAYEEIAQQLNAGAVALVPTDTVYGLAVSPAHPQSIQRLYRLKQRAVGKNLPIMVADAESLKELGADLNPAAKRMLDSRWMPGPVSLVLSIKASSAPDWLRYRDEIAVRIPNHAFMLELLRRTGPLLVTSANRSGLPTPAEAKHAAKQLAGEPDLIVDLGPRQLLPSTLVNCRVLPPKIERVGVVSKDDIEKHLYGR